MGEEPLKRAAVRSRKLAVAGYRQSDLVPYASLRKHWGILMLSTLDCGKQEINTTLFEQPKRQQYFRRLNQRLTAKLPQGRLGAGSFFNFSSWRAQHCYCLRLSGRGKSKFYSWEKLLDSSSLRRWFHSQELAWSLCAPL